MICKIKNGEVLLQISTSVCLRKEINTMTAIEKIGLEDLQELAEYFANLKVVDMKMNTKILQISWSSLQVPPKKSVGSHNDMRDPRTDFHIGGESHPVGTRLGEIKFLYTKPLMGKLFKIRDILMGLFLTLMY